MHKFNLFGDGIFIFMPSNYLEEGSGLDSTSLGKDIIGFFLDLGDVIFFWSRR